jgi:hypothetical protein
MINQQVEQVEIVGMLNRQGIRCRHQEEIRGRHLGVQDFLKIETLLWISGIFHRQIVMAVANVRRPDVDQDLQVFFFSQIIIVKIFP